jgi:hypothetical protein
VSAEGGKKKKTKSRQKNGKYNTAKQDKKKL